MIVANFYFSDAKVNEIIVSEVQEATGGLLEIERIQFDLFTGLRLEGVSFSPPQTEQGFIHGGPVYEKPLLLLKQLRCEYDLFRLFKGELHLSDLTLVSPQIYLEEQDHLPFYFMSQYRKKRFPAPQKEEPIVEKSDNTDFASLLSLIETYDPKTLYLPFRVEIGKLGILGSSLHYRKLDEQGILEDKLFKGISLISSLEYSGNQSHIQLRVETFEDELFELILESRKNNGVTEDLYLSSMLNLEFVVNNFQSIAADFNLMIVNFKNQSYQAQNLEVIFGSEILFDAQANMLALKNLNLSVFEDLLNIGLKGKIGILNPEKSLIDLDLSSAASANLDSAKPLFSILKVPYTAAGMVEIERLGMTGIVDLEEIQTGAIEKMPVVNLDSRLKGVNLRLGDPFLLQGLNGTLAATSTGINQKIIVDSQSDISFTSMSLALGGEVDLDISHLFFKSLARGEYPSQDIPLARVSIEAEKWSYTTKGTSFISDLYLSTNNAFEFSTKNLESSFRLDMKDLLNLSMLTECENLCDSIRADLNVFAEDLGRLLPLAKPYASQLPEEYLPNSFDGRINVNATLSGNIKELKQEKLIEFLQRDDFSYRIYSSLDDVHVEVPYGGTKLKGFSLELGLEGDQRSQKIRFDTRLGSLVHTTAGTGSKSQRYSLGKTQFRTRVHNTLSAPDTLKNLPKFTSSAIEVELDLRDIGSETLLASSDIEKLQKLSSVILKGALKQESVRNVNLNDLSLTVSDLGLQTTTNGKMSLTDFKPENMDITFDAVLEELQNSGLVKGLNTKGSTQIGVKVGSNDMKVFDIGGGIEFKHFGIDVRGQENQPLLQVNGVDGKIPFSQKINIHTPDGVQAASVQEDKGLSKKIDQYMSQFSSLSDNKDLSLLSITNYDSIKTFDENSKTLSIRRIDAANLSIKEIEIDLEVKQNLFSLNQMLMNFLEGAVQGSLLVFFDPMPKKIDTAFHLTRLNTYRLLDSFPDLRGQTDRGLFGENPFIDGTVHLSFDLITNDLKGSFNLTSVGKEQLKMILLYVDPQESDPTINQIRTALNFGTLQGVEIVIRNGEVSIDVAIGFLNMLALPVPKIEKIPLSRIMSNLVQSDGKKVNQKEKI